MLLPKSDILHLDGESFSLAELLTSVMQAGEAILSVRSEGRSAPSYKSDRSPVTAADLAADSVLQGYLRGATPSIPIVSEEDKESNAPSTEAWWLIDPLDGTSGFVRGSEEFCVCVALIRRRVPILGFIGIPCKREVFFGGPILGSTHRYAAGSIQQSWSSEALPIPPPWRILTSSRQQIRRESEWLAHFPAASQSAQSSAIKYASIAKGRFDLHARRDALHEWDTAAGHAIVTGAGGAVLNIDGEELLYGKPHFVHSRGIVVMRSAAMADEVKGILTSTR